LLGAIVGTALAMSTVTQDSEWVIDCECPMTTLRRDIQVKPKLNLPIPGAPANFMSKRRDWVSVSFLPDIIEFNEAGVSSSLSYSFSPETRGLKGELLRRLGLVEVKSRGFGATLRFAAAPNWAMQFKGTKRVTIAYITRF
jgi:hypothetical protein